MKNVMRFISILLVFIFWASPLMAFAADPSTVVIITKTGECYHLDWCPTLKSHIETTLADAVARGFRPCSVCNPPTLGGSLQPSTPSNPTRQPSVPAQTPSYYTDLYPSAYYYKAVTNLSEKKIIGGFPDGSFKPDQTVTRAQLAVMLVNAKGLSTSPYASSNFIDVTKSHWAYPFITAVSNAGYIGGYPDGSFKPEKEVSYDEALTMIIASLGYKMSDLNGTYPKCFTDKAKEIGVLNTCDKIGASGATRAEVSCFLSDSFSAKKAPSADKYVLGYYEFDVPRIWGDAQRLPNGMQWTATTSGNASILQITHALESDINYDVSFEGLLKDHENMIEMMETSLFEEVTDYLIVETDSVDGILYYGTIKGDTYTGNGWWYTFPSENDRFWYHLICIQADASGYSYYNDFMKVIYSIKQPEEMY